MYADDADEMTSSEDPDQTNPISAAWSGSALFVQTYLSQHLEFLLLVKLQTLTIQDYLCKFSIKTYVVVPH